MVAKYWVCHPIYNLDNEQFTKNDRKTTIVKFENHKICKNVLGYERKLPFWLEKVFQTLMKRPFCDLSLETFKLSAFSIVQNH